MIRRLPKIARRLPIFSSVVATSTMIISERLPKTARCLCLWHNIKAIACFIIKLRAVKRAKSWIFMPSKRAKTRLSRKLKQIWQGTRRREVSRWQRMLVGDESVNLFWPPISRSATRSDCLFSTNPNQGFPQLNESIKIQVLFDLIIM